MINHRMMFMAFSLLNFKKICSDSSSKTPEEQGMAKLIFNKSGLDCVLVQPNIGARVQISPVENGQWAKGKQALSSG